MWEETNSYLMKISAHLLFDGWAWENSEPGGTKLKDSFLPCGASTLFRQVHFCRSSHAFRCNSRSDSCSTTAGRISSNTTRNWKALAAMAVYICEFNASSNKEIRRGLQWYFPQGQTWLWQIEAGDRWVLSNVVLLFSCLSIATDFCT
jgi:hypothetical protein